MSPPLSPPVSRSGLNDDGVKFASVNTSFALRISVPRNDTTTVLLLLETFRHTAACVSVRAFSTNITFSYARGVASSPRTLSGRVVASVAQSPSGLIAHTPASPSRRARARRAASTPSATALSPPAASAATPAPASPPPPIDLDARFNPRVTSVAAGGLNGRNFNFIASSPPPPTPPSPPGSGTVISLPPDVISRRARSTTSTSPPLPVTASKTAVAASSTRSSIGTRAIPMRSSALPKSSSNTRHVSVRADGEASRRTNRRATASSRSPFHRGARVRVFVFVRCDDAPSARTTYGSDDAPTRTSVLGRPSHRTTVASSTPAKTSRTKSLR